MKRIRDTLLVCLKLIALALFLALWAQGYLHEYGV